MGITFAATVLWVVAASLLARRGRLGEAWFQLAWSELDHLSRRDGLDWVGSSDRRLRGTVRGVDVGVTLSPGALPEMLIWARLPAELALGLSLDDGVLRIAGVEAEELASVQALARSLGPLTLWAGHLRIEGDRLTIQGGPELGGYAAHCLDVLVDVVGDVSSAVLGPWRRLADAHALTRGVARDCPLRMAGTVDGVAVEVELRHAPRTRRLGTVVRARLATRLPGDLVLRGGSGEGTMTLHNPVLRMLVTAEGQDPAAANRLLDDEALCHRVIEVVHGWPGSWVGPDQVLLRADGLLSARLEEAVAMVVELTQALEEA
ncbi:MAG: hypothetical protein H6739_01010 [Alphaproteobacteria bacterium]|nr:hypothetical protein [Alphaproteobacteria bacterium]